MFFFSIASAYTLELLQVLDCNKETETHISLRDEGLETNYMIIGIKCAKQAYYMFNFIFIRTIQFTHVRKHGMRSSFIAVVTSLNFALQTTVSIRSTNLLWKRKHHAALSKHRQETKSRLW